MEKGQKHDEVASGVVEQTETREAKDKVNEELDMVATFSDKNPVNLDYDSVEGLG